jgi:hypothetical protein
VWAGLITLAVNVGDLLFPDAQAFGDRLVLDDAVLAVVAMSSLQDQ